VMVVVVVQCNCIDVRLTATNNSPHAILGSSAGPHPTGGSLLAVLATAFHCVVHDDGRDGRAVQHCATEKRPCWSSCIGLWPPPPLPPTPPPTLLFMTIMKQYHTVGHTRTHKRNTEYVDLASRLVGLDTSDQAVQSAEGRGSDCNSASVEGVRCNAIGRIELPASCVFRSLISSALYRFNSSAVRFRLAPSNSL
jgi:hypothetical protein